MAHAMFRRNGSEGFAARNPRGNARQLLSETARSPLRQEDGFVHREVPLLDHAASFPIGVA
jgi:hypothetical protein